MALTCRHCDKPIPAGNLELGGRVALCPACDALFAVTDSGGKGKRRGKKRLKRPKGLPDGITVELGDDDDGGERLVIIRKWVDILSLLFLAIGLIILIYWYVWFEELQAGALTGEGLLLPVVHALFGLALAYYGLAGIINRSIITVTRRGLTVAHRPLPWFGTGTTRSDKIAWIRCEQREQITRNRRVLLSYAIGVERKNGSSRYLLSGIDNLA